MKYILLGTLKILLSGTSLVLNELGSGSHVTRSLLVMNH